MGDSRYWVSYKRAFASPLQREQVELVASYFGKVAAELKHLPMIEGSSVSLSDHGGITLSGIVRAIDQVGALATAEGAFGKALAAVGTVPDLPDSPHGPKWKAHELLGSAVPSVKLLTAA